MLRGRTLGRLISKLHYRRLFMICTRMVQGRWIAPAAAALATLLSAGIGYGSTIDTTPSGLAPGTKYQLVFVTSDGFFANSSSISTYNTDVTTEAALDA